MAREAILTCGALSRLMKHVGRFAVLSVVPVLAVHAAAHAQGQAGDQQSQGQPGDRQSQGQAVDQQSQGQTGTAKRPQRQPPPLFSKHHRGIHKNAQGVDVLDATPQSPPLETDDPGVPEKGEYEINLTTQADLSKAMQRVDLMLVDANYGVLPKIVGHELPTQVKLEFPVAAARQKGSPFTLGVGAAIFGLKFNFYNDLHKGMSVAVYPQIEFATPGSHGVEKGLAEPGQTVIVPLLVSKELKYFTLVANGAVNAPIHDPDRSPTGTFGVGFGRAIRNQLAGMVEVRGESTFDLKRDRLVTLNVGVIRGVGRVVVYANLGRSLFSDDGFTHAYVGVGLKMLIRPQQNMSAPAGGRDP